MGGGEQTASPRTRRPVWSAALAAALVVAFLLGMSLTSYLEARSGARSGSLPEQLAIGTAFGWLVLLGALLTWRQPRNPMGWVLGAAGLLVALGPPGPAYVDFVLRDGGEPSAGLAMLGWVNNVYWPALLGLVFVFVPLLFPDGRLPSRAWRALAWLAGLSIAGLCLLGGLAEHITTQGAGHVIDNPLGVAGVPHPEESALGGALFAGLLVGVLGAFASLAVRFRRSHGPERLQVKWLLFASGLVVLAWLAEPLQQGGLRLVNVLMTAVSFNAVPMAITVAILRYRLYAIDRIISRTLSYGAVVLVLLATYATGVVLLGRLLVPLGTGSDLAVAASTLAAAALFRPLLTRVRSVVDRRFDRARYDAKHTVETFAHRLRDEVDLDALAAELRSTASTTMQPRDVELWLRSLEARR